jgi:hypothetical protein
MRAARPSVNESRAASRCLEAAQGAASGPGSAHTAIFWAIAGAWSFLRLRAHGMGGADLGRPDRWLRSRSGDCGVRAKPRGIETTVHDYDGSRSPGRHGQPNFQISGKDIDLAGTGLAITDRRYASRRCRTKAEDGNRDCRLIGVYADDATEVQVHIGSVLLAIWLVIGGIAAGQRSDYKGPIGCSRASTIAVTIIAGPLNYAGVHPDINCTMRPSN